jgi:hypothetical protein
VSFFASTMVKSTSGFRAAHAVMLSRSVVSQTSSNMAIVTPMLILAREGPHPGATATQASAISNTAAPAIFIVCFSPGGDPTGALAGSTATTMRRPRSRLPDVSERLCVFGVDPAVLPACVVVYAVDVPIS